MQDLIPEVILNQEYHTRMGPICDGCAMDLCDHHDYDNNNNNNNLFWTLWIDEWTLVRRIWLDVNTIYFLKAQDGADY